MVDIWLIFPELRKKSISNIVDFHFLFAEFCCLILVRSHIPCKGILSRQMTIWPVLPDIYILGNKITLLQAGSTFIVLCLGI